MQATRSPVDKKRQWEENVSRSDITAAVFQTRRAGGGESPEKDRWKPCEEAGPVNTDRDLPYKKSGQPAKATAAPTGVPFETQSS